MKKILFVALFLITVNLFSDIQFAKKLFFDGLIEESRKEFEKTVNEAPASEQAADALYYIALGYIQQNNYHQAINTLKKIISGYKKYNKSDLVYLKIAKSYLEIKDYKNAIDYFDKLFKNYPTSSNMKKSLKSYADALFLSKDYNQAILTIEKLIKNYSTDKSIPYLYLILAKSYYYNGISDKSIMYANTIIRKFPDSNERWETEKFLMKVKNPNTSQKIELLKKLLTKNLPRKYDEEFSYLLSLSYISANQLDNAAKKLSYIVKKYGNSDKLCIYLNKLMEINNKLSRFQKNITLFNSYKKKLPENRCKTKIRTLLAKSLIETKHFEEAENILQKINRQTRNDTLLLQIGLLKSELLVSTDKFIPAIKNYLITAENYPKLGKTNLIYYRIGTIYKTKLHNYEKAIEYFMKISPYYANYTNVLLDISDCYEKLQNYEKALSTLNEIELDTIDDKKLKENIKKHIAYIRNFKIQNYKRAFDNLLNALTTYQNTKNDSLYLTNLIKIYTEDLKKYDNAYFIAQNSSNDYLKCKILLKIIKKRISEGNSAKPYENELKQSMQKLKDEKYTEITIEKEILAGTNKDAIEKMKNFIKRYPNSSATNRFKSYIGEYYLNRGKIEAAKDYIISLNPLSDKETYYKLKLALAEYFYKNDNDNQALKLYEEIQDKINLTRPKILFHYSVVLYQTGKKQKAINKLTYLVNNTDFFESKQNIIFYLTKILSEQNDYKQTIEYLKTIPEKYRDDQYYHLLAQAYYQLTDFENAKIMLMHIKNKDTATLKMLADLQIKTNDKEMAIYTLKTLLKKTINKTDYYLKLGELYFDTKQYKNAEKYLSLYTKNKVITQKDKEIVIKLIISYLKNKNRPKADILKKQYKKLFDKTDMAKINLNYGIYYIDIDFKTALKKFKSVIKSKEIDKDLKYEAYFWSGVTYLKRKKTSLALENFISALHSSNKTLLNNIHLKLGTIYFSKEEYDKALKNYLYVIENAGKDKLAYDAAKNFAMVCKTTSEWEKAIETYNLILEKWGNDKKIKAETIFDIAFCYFRDKKYPKAIEYFKKSLQLSEDNETLAEAQYWIGESYYGMENYQDAITEFLKVYYNYPELVRWSASSQLKAADSYIKIGEFSKAKKILKRIISTYGKTSRWGKQAETYLNAI